MTHPFAARFMPTPVKPPAPLSAKKLLAVESLIACPTIAEAARQAGASEQSLHRWLRESDFVAALKAAQAASLRGVVDLLRHYARDAVDRLQMEMRDIDNPPSVRVNAADKLLGQLARLSDFVEVRDEIEAIRAEVAELKNPPQEAAKHG
jgi:hypothetical protein